MFFFSFPGSPPPSLIWYSASDGDIVDDRFSVLSGSNDVDSDPKKSTVKVQNTLRIATLTKKHFGKTFVCEAKNNNVSTPARNRITVDMRREF